jgi:diphosphomevalonate decarboxylase
MNNSQMEGKVRWKSPSNIALVKYWGKHGNQLPNNPSLSMTLQDSFTDTEVSFKLKKEKGLELEFVFEGKPAPDFE